MRQIIVIIALFIFPVLAAANEPVTLLSMQMQPSANITTIIFTLNRQTTGRVKYLPAQKQLLVDFANTKKRFTMQNARLSGANVVSISSVDLPNNGVRFVLTVLGKVRWSTKFTKPTMSNKAATLELIVVSAEKRQVVSARRQGSGAPLTVTPSAKPVVESAIEADIFKILAEQKNNIGRSRLENQVKATIAEKQRKFTVVIDAGHGGKDTGAIGGNGTKEKTVVLSIAKRLATLINQTTNMRAVLTRDGDYFVPLRQRMKLARKDEADLFVAIHADAYFEPHAKGASVYALSTRAATSEAARWLAQKDNYSELDGVEFNALQDRSTLLRSVLIDMSQTATIQDSLRLGNRVLDAIDDISTLHHKHVEQAPFMVLRSPDIPSILIETGFISNPHEEKRLADAAYQDKLARAILRGIQMYR